VHTASGQENKTGDASVFFSCILPLVWDLLINYEATKGKSYLKPQQSGFPNTFSLLCLHTFY